MSRIIVLLDNDPNLIRVKARYGETHKIEAVLGTRITLSELQPNESVVYGDGEYYHFRLTKKEPHKS